MDDKKSTEFYKAENNWLLQELENTLLQLENYALKWEKERQLIYTELNSKIERYKNLYLGAILALSSALEAKDPYTRGHSKRVTQISIAIAKELDMPRGFIEELKIAGLLHDVGKIGISEVLLKKPSKLTPAEFDTIKNHPLEGVKILKNIDQMERVCSWIKHHHERYDGNGYPSGLRGREIPLASRIIAVADAFDAMVSDRPYRKGKPLETVLKEMKRAAARQHDPNITKALVKIFERGIIKAIYQNEGGEAYEDLS